MKSLERHVSKKTKEESPPRVDASRASQGKRKIEKVSVQTTISSEAHDILTSIAENLGGVALNYVIEVALYNLHDTAQNEPGRLGRVVSERMFHGKKNGHDSDPGASGEARSGGGKDPR